MDQEKLARLVDSMQKRGWDGRPLLVEHLADYYQAWTGSHRYAAAVEVLGVGARIPVLILSAFDQHRMDDFNERHDLRRPSHTHYTLDDNERLLLLEEAGLVRSAQLMREELANLPW